MPKSSEGEIDRTEKAAATGVGPVRRLRVVVPVILGAPVRGRNLRDCIQAVADVGPEPSQVVGVGKQAAHSDDGHRNGLRGIGLTQFSSLSSVAAGGGDVIVSGSSMRSGRPTMVSSRHPLLNVGVLTGSQPRVAWGKDDPL